VIPTTTAIDLRLRPTGHGCYRCTYDGGDNIRTTTTDAGTPVTYTYTYTYNQQNELTVLHAPAYANVDTYYAYDQSGNTMAITAPVSGSLTAPGAINTSLSYDAAGRPLKVTLKDGRTMTLAYNAQGERSSYSVITGTQTLYSAQFAYQDSQLAQATVYSATATGSVQYTDSYVYNDAGLPDHFDRQQNGTTSRYWYEADGRGDVVAVTDASGNVVDTYEYDLWGEPLTGTMHETVPQRLRYTGLWYDTEPQWYWDASGNRYYDPELDRYLQPDAPGGRYVFAGDDPIGTDGSVGFGATHVGGVGPRIVGVAGTVQPSCEPCVDGGGEGGGGDQLGDPYPGAGGGGSPSPNESRSSVEDVSLAGLREYPDQDPGDLRTVPESEVIRSMPKRLGDIVRRRFIFVISNDDRLLMLREPTPFHHPDLVGGRRVHFAGEMQFDSRGQLAQWSDSSGHYTPNPSESDIETVSRWLQTNKFWRIDL